MSKPKVLRTYRWGKYVVKVYETPKKQKQNQTCSWTGRTTCSRDFVEESSDRLAKLSMSLRAQGIGG